MSPFRMQLRNFLEWMFSREQRCAFPIRERAILFL